MGKLTPVITGKFFAFDSSPLIYYIEQHPQYAPVTEDLFAALDRGDARGMTSVLTLLEVLVRPLRSGLVDLAHQYRELLSILLRKHRVALALVDQVWMPTITQLAEKLDGSPKLRTLLNRRLAGLGGHCQIGNAPPRSPSIGPYCGEDPIESPLPRFARMEGSAQVTSQLIAVSILRNCKLRFQPPCFLRLGITRLKGVNGLNGILDFSLVRPAGSISHFRPAVSSLAPDAVECPPEREIHVPKVPEVNERSAKVLRRQFFPLVLPPARVPLTSAPVLLAT